MCVEKFYGNTKGIKVKQKDGRETMKRGNYEKKNQRKKEEEVVDRASFYNDDPA